MDNIIQTAIAIFKREPSPENAMRLATLIARKTSTDIGVGSQNLVTSIRFMERTYRNNAITPTMVAHVRAKRRGTSVLGTPIVKGSPVIHVKDGWMKSYQKRFTLTTEELIPIIASTPMEWADMPDMLEIRENYMLANPEA